MPTWEETQTYLRSQYRLIKDEVDWLGIEWSISCDGEVARQRLKIECVHAWDEPWLLLRSAICDESNIDTRGALRYNALIAIGSLMIENGRCYLRATLPLDKLTWAQLDRAVEFVVRESTKLRTQGAGEDPATALFRGFAE